MRRVMTCVVLMIGCGRVAFDPRADAFNQDAFSSCVSGDGVCPVNCVGTDTDCATTCGDGVCVGNAGELCGNCMADCATQQAVCGNARCDTGEAADCYADCGPVPWTWEGREDNLFAEVNRVRVAGVICPGTASRRTAPALTRATSSVTKNAAREWAWESAHHNYNGSVDGNEGGTCNGLDSAGRRAEGDFDAGLLSNQSSAAAAVASWASRDTLCPILMNSSLMRGMTAVAVDQRPAYILLLK